MFYFSCRVSLGIWNFSNIDYFWFKFMSINYRVVIGWNIFWNILEFSPYLENCVGDDVISLKGKSVGGDVNW